MKVVFKKLTVVILSVLFLAALVNPLSAQEVVQPREPVKTIFDFKAELRLTDDQAKRIRELLTSLVRETKVLRAKLTIVDDRLQRLLETDGDLNLIRTKIKEAFDLQASIRIADIEASRKINAVLRPEQLKQWREIQEAAAK